MLQITQDVRAVTTDLEPVTTYLEPDVKEGLKQWAKRERRTLSNLAAHILTTAYEQQQQQTKDA